MPRSFRKFMVKVLLLFLLGFATPVCIADDIPTPVTDKLLRKHGLDRNYHICISVADGDTLTLKDLGAIRFVGVDTPEKNHPKLPVQFMSKEASAFTKKRCLGKNIRLEYDPYDEDKRGKYGRVLGYLYLEDGTFMQDAYSGRSRPPIPDEAGHRFRLIPATDSGASRPPIPEHSGHLFN